MIPFRQLILPGDVGTDVLAVKDTLKRMGVMGSGAMSMSPKAGPAFVATIRKAQLHGGILVDGKYGKDTHGLIAPHFSAEDVSEYQTATIRTHEPPPLPAGNGAAAAKKLLQLQAQGKYHADNPLDLGDIQATAQGKAVHSQHGGLVHIDGRVMKVLVHLIEDLGHTIGTFAICSDHHDDGPHGHAGGMAVDVSTIDGHSVASASARAVVLQLDRQLHNAGALTPRQLISGGVGNVRDMQISALSIPGADSFYGSATMAQHCNHVHVGY
jgi:hypothetical protein